MTHTPGPPESCGDCHDGFHPQIGTVAIDPNAIICNLIGDDAISDADRLNPDCPRIEKPQKQPAKAEIVSELAAVKKINAALLETLEKTAADRAYTAGLGVSEWEAFLEPHERAAIATARP